MLKYPLDPPHARILISSFDLGCPSEIIDILSIVNSGPLFIDRAADRESAATSRTKFIHRDGDHLTQLNVSELIWPSGIKIVDRFHSG
jgi:HrpA-like RNA helicase